MNIIERSKHILAMSDRPVEEMEELHKKIDQAEAKKERISKTYADAVATGEGDPDRLIQEIKSLEEEITNHEVALRTLANVGIPNAARELYGDFLPVIHDQWEHQAEIRALKVAAMHEGLAQLMAMAEDLGEFDRKWAQTIDQALKVCVLFDEPTALARFGLKRMDFEPFENLDDKLGQVYGNPPQWTRLQVA